MFIGKYCLGNTTEKQEEKEENAILVPDNYTVKRTPYGLYKVKEIAEGLVDEVIPRKRLGRGVGQSVLGNTYP